MKAIRTLSTMVAILTLTALATTCVGASSKHGGHHPKPGGHPKKSCHHPKKSCHHPKKSCHHPKPWHKTVKNKVYGSHYKNVVINRRFIVQRNLVGPRVVIRPVSPDPDSVPETLDPGLTPETVAPPPDVVPPPPNPVRQVGPVTLKRIGLTADQLEADFSRLMAAGYRLILIRGYAVAGEERFDATWRNDDGPDFVARAGQTPEEFAETAEALADEGYALAHVSRYRVGGEERRAAIWVLR